MIYTVTLNPSLDYIASVDSLTPGSVNRSYGEFTLPGGKGMDVSVVLNNLGMDSTVLGFVAGFVGEEIRKRIALLGIRQQCIRLSEGCSRINVKLRSENETEINGSGPVIPKEACEQFFQQLDMLQAGDMLVLAGSIPSSLPVTMYRDIMEHLQGKNIKVVVDAIGDLLLNVLSLHPFLVKPNHHELGDLFGVTLKDKKEVATYAKKLQEQGAQNVLVSMGAKGAVLVSEDGQVYEKDAPEGKVVYTVGSGDAMVAGFLYGYQTYGDYESALKMGLAAGSASAFSEHLATGEEIKKMYEKCV